MRRLFAALTALLLAWPAAALAQPADLPPAGAGRVAYAPFEPLMDRTWRGTGVGPEAVEDIQRWEWAVGGHAVRVLHSVNGGAYAGETLIFRDRDSGAYTFHYFTTGGFHTTGAMTPTGPGAFEIDETVHGVEGLTRLRSTMTVEADGVRRARTRTERNGEWIEVGGFDYREDPTARVVMPPLAQAGREAPATVGPLALSRRIVRGVDEAGQDVAGYLRISNSAGAEDQLVAASCACAERVEFHQVRRSAEGASMDTDPVWTIPAGGALDVRPGSNLHLMLIGYDPARAADGKVTVTLTFRDAGAVTADFDLVEDSAAAWTAFD